MVSKKRFCFNLKVNKSHLLIQYVDFNLARDGSKWTMRDKLAIAEKDWKIFFITLHRNMIPKMDWLEFSEMNGDNVEKLRTNCTAFAAKLIEDSVSSKLWNLNYFFDIQTIDCWMFTFTEIVQPT